MPKIHEPIRMCVLCRERKAQKELLRFSNIEGKIALYSGIGRSFYICESCTHKSDQEIKKAFSRFAKTSELNLKEIFQIWLTTLKSAT